MPHVRRARRLLLLGKRTLIGMANTWLKLAEQYLKNSETTLVHETPTPRLKASDDDLK